jgi:hypothetical protein
MHLSGSKKLERIGARKEHVSVGGSTKHGMTATRFFVEKYAWILPPEDDESAQQACRSVERLRSD